VHSLLESKNETDPRANLETELLEIIERCKEFKVWKDYNGRYLCGFASWEGRRISMASSERLERLKENPESFRSDKFTYKNLQKASNTELIAEIFNWLGDPVQFDDLVELVPLFRQIKAQPAAAIEPAKKYQEPQPAAPAQQSKDGSENPKIVVDLKKKKTTKRTDEEIKPLPPSWGKSFADRWKPAYSVAALLLVGLASLATILFSGREATSTGSATLPSPTSTVAPAPDVSGANRIDSLVDGERVIQFDESGVVSGLENFPAELKQNITEALLTGKPQRSADLTELVSDPEQVSSAWLLYPKRVVITEDRPTFRWAPRAGASDYQVRIGYPNGNRVASSGQLPSDVTEWQPETKLRRGVIYTWSVVATVDGQEVVAEANFRLLGWDKMGELGMLKNQYQSHLALGVFYIREGVLIQARREFQQLANDNPKSPIVARLLREAQTWR
jgi:hypothetical protein